jgi:hypothetical protein
VSSILHITNGDIAADLLGRSHLSGDILPWRDALHDGPVPSGLSLTDLSRVRSEFIEKTGWARGENAREMFAERDTALSSSSHDEIVLWFEHDLYDQLQLLQILDWCAARPPGRLTLIEVGEFPGIAKFVGLGQLAPSQLAGLFEHRRDVTPAMTALARRAWAAFTSGDPRNLEAILREETFLMPFLQDAILRELEEFPSAENGLGRTEQQLLEAATGDRTLQHLYHACQRREERAFMADTILKWRLRLLSDGPSPLLTGRARRLAFEGEGAAFWDQEAVLTPSGRSVLENKADAVRLRGIDRWLGGVHLSGKNPAWRWNRQERRLVKAA